MDRSRNIGIFTPKQQELIENCRVCILGVGLGSVIAELALRTGFRKLLLVDADTVSPTNLNRQSYTQLDLGKAKVKATQKRLLHIDPTAEFEIRNEFLTPENTHELLNNCDFIVDTIDLSSIRSILALHLWARNAQKPIIFPFNIGWKSVVSVFTKDSCSLEEFLKLSDSAIADVDRKDFRFWAEFLGRFVPDYGKEAYRAFLENASNMSDWCPAPQLGITASATASVVVSCLVKLAIGFPVLLAPEVAEIDLFSISQSHIG